MKAPLALGRYCYLGLNIEKCKYNCNLLLKQHPPPPPKTKTNQNNTPNPKNEKKRKEKENEGQDAGVFGTCTGNFQTLR